MYKYLLSAVFLVLYSGNVFSLPVISSELFNSPNLSSLKMSPDGELVVAHQLDGLVRRLVIVDVKTNTIYKKSTFKLDNYFNNAEWIDNDTIFITYHNNESDHGLVVDLDKNNLSAKPVLKDVPYDGYLLHALPSESDNLLYARYVGKKSEIKVFRVSVKNLVSKNIGKGEQYKAHMNDAVYYSYDQYRDIMFSLVYSKDDGFGYWYRSGEKSSWKRVYSWKDAEVSFSALAYLGADNFLVLTNIDTDKVVLAEFNSKSQSVGKIVYENVNYDLISADVDVDGEVHSVSYIDHGKLSHQYFSVRARRLNDSLVEYFPDSQVVNVSRSLKSGASIIYAFSSTDSGGYYFFNEQTSKLRLIGKAYPQLEQFELARTEVINIPVESDIKVEALLTKASRFDNGVLLVMPHGGPIEVRDYDFYDPNIQFLAGRGYSILRVNFRGSSGFGKKFSKAGVGEFGKAIESDVIKAVDFVREKYQFSRACSIGSSYGGYSAMMLAIEDPDFYRCAIGMYGVYDLPLLFNTSNVKLSSEYRRALSKTVGENSEELRGLSPVYLYEEINNENP